MVLPLEDLLYVEIQGHDAVACFPDSQQRFRLSLSELERLLPWDRFCRCHNSFLVNMSYIRGIDRRALELDHGGQIPVGRNYDEAAQAQFIRYPGKSAPDNFSAVGKLETRQDDVMAGQKIAFSGSTGIEFFFKFLFISYEKILCSVGFQVEVDTAPAGPPLRRTGRSASASTTNP